jgi:hypothetical protein
LKTSAKVKLATVAASLDCGRISANQSGLPSGATVSWTDHQSIELPMTNTQWQMLDFQPRVTPHGFSGLKIGN